MAEVKVKTIHVDYWLCGDGDPADMITITRRQFREALAYCLAAFHKAGGVDDEGTNDSLTRICGTFAGGLEYVLFDKEN